MECPDRDCRESIKECLSKKVSRTVLAIFITVVLAILSIGIGGPLLYSMAAEKKQNEEISDFKTKLGEFSVMQRVIIKNQEEFKEDIETIQKESVKRDAKQEKDKQDIIDAIKEINK